MADTPIPEQIQQTPPREVLVDAWRYKNPSGIVIGVLLALFYFILAGYVPIAYIQNGYTDGTTYVNLYSHVFRYSQFFGWLTILLLIPPVLYLTSDTPFRRAKRKLVLLAFILGLSLVLLALAFHSANVAPFGVKREQLQNDPRLSKHFMKKAPTEVEREEYQKRMLELHQNRANWSTGRYLYYIAVFMQIFKMLFILFVAGALCFHRITSPQDARSSEFKGALLYCSLAILVAYLWLLMRFAFVEQKIKYFPDVYNLAGEITVAAVFVLLSVIFVTVHFSWLFGKYTFLLSLVPLCLGVFGPLSFKSSLVSVFGKDVGVLPYVTILVLIVGGLGFVFAVVLTMGDDQNSKRPQSPSEPPSP